MRLDTCSPRKDMANLDGSLENKTIVFKENDLVLNTWRLQVSRLNPRGLSLLIKAALRHYIRTNSFCCIGRVCVKNPPAEARKKHTVCMSLTNSQDIISWLKTSKSVGITQPAMIKSVLTRSIQVVDDESLAWIPSPIEIFEIANLEHGSAFQEKSPIVQPAHGGLAGHVPPPDVNVTEGAQGDANKKRKKPRAAALRGVHYS